MNQQNILPKPFPSCVSCGKPFISRKKKTCIPCRKKKHKNRYNYSETNDIGSDHWFATLLGLAKHNAEFLSMVDADKDTVTRTAIEIKKILDDLIEAHEKGIIYK